MTKQARNEYGVPTKEFREATAPHEAAIRKAVHDLMGQGWDDAEVYQALIESVSLTMSNHRLSRALKMRKEEKARAESCSGSSTA
jgi:hypothetical protein